MNLGYAAGTTAQTVNIATSSQVGLPVMTVQSAGINNGGATDNVLIASDVNIGDNFMTPSITFDATVGSATFKGPITSGHTDTSVPYFEVNRADATYSRFGIATADGNFAGDSIEGDTCLQLGSRLILSPGTNNTTVRIDPTRGDFSLGGTNADPKIALNGFDGSARFTVVFIQADGVNGLGFHTKNVLGTNGAFAVINGSDTKAVIKGDGSATFAGGQCSIFNSGAIDNSQSDDSGYLSTNFITTFRDDGAKSGEVVCV